MKKYNLFMQLFFLVFFAKLNSQILNGQVSYGITTSYKNQIEQVNKTILKIKNIETKMIFTLNFNKKESYFFLNSIIEDNEISSDLFCGLTSMHKGTYCNLKESKYKILKSSSIIGNYSMNYERKSDWILSNETKMINGYLCFKATSFFYNDSGWVDNLETNITAWYTTKIPVPFGPNGYHGLPGLILEVQNGVSTIYIKSISLNLEKEPKIDTLESFKNLTFQQEMDSEYSTMPMLKKNIIEHTTIEKQKSDEIQKRIDERKILEKNN